MLYFDRCNFTIIKVMILKYFAITMFELEIHKSFMPFKILKFAETERLNFKLI